MARASHTAGILVVEDDPVIAMGVAAVLSDLGFRDVYLAHDLATGLRLVSRGPRLAILDVNLGGHLVFPLAVELRARRIPIVFSTGRAAKDLPPEWAAHPILPKPLEPRALAAAVEALGLQ